MGGDPKFAPISAELNLDVGASTVPVPIADAALAAARPLRVCILVPGHWSAVKGGAQYQAMRLVEALVAAGGFEVYYLTRDAAPGHAPTHYHLQRIESGARARGLGRLRFDARWIPRLLNAIKPDLIYQRVGCAYTGIAARYARRYGAALVWHVASDEDVAPPAWPRLNAEVVYRWLDRRLLRYGIAHATHIVTQTDDQARSLARHYGRRAQAVVRNFHPLPDPVPTLADKAGPLTVVWIANVKALKRPELFIRLAVELSDLAGVRFVMIGALQGGARWRAATQARMQTAANLDYRGVLTQGAVNEQLVRAHVLVNTSRWEGFSNTFIQAWMRRVPVVSLDVNPDGVFDERRLGIHAGSYAALKEAVRRLIEHRELRDSMGEWAQRYAFAHHGERNAGELIDLFRRACGRDNPPPREQTPARTNACASPDPGAQTL